MTDSKPPQEFEAIDNIEDIDSIEGLENFESIENIVAEPLKFKAKLNIGEDAYTSLRVKNKVFEAWDAAGVAVTAAAVAKSSTVATAFLLLPGSLLLWV